MDANKQDGKLFAEIDPGLAGKRLKGKDSWGMFGGGRPADSAKELQGTVEDLFSLVRRFTGEPALGYSLPFRLTERVLRE
ncbi:MAG: hypothetical protein LBQ12_05165 [Deltaproteobacteria bacterium]|jgi:hypothetical protein|nr:hypothetical protein [Deltaproteobacteria bacterium]